MLSCSLSGSDRFPAGPQLLTKLVTGQMACGAVMVPTTMFMGQVVTAFAPQQGQTQTISISQQPTQQQQQHQHQQHQQEQQQSQVTAMQPGQAPLAGQQTQFLQVQCWWRGAFRLRCAALGLNVIDGLVSLPIT